MPVNIRPYPVLKGKDAERFLKRQQEHKHKLEEPARKLLETQSKNQDKD